MIRVIFISIALFFTTIHYAAAQDKDGLYSKDFQVNTFTKIDLEGSYRVYLYQSDRSYLTVKAPTTEMLDILQVSSDNASLVLNVRKKQFNLSRMELHISFKNLEELRISGGVKVTTDGYLDLNDINVFVEGGASVDMNLKARNIDINCNGGVLFGLKGVADHLTVKVSGAGHVNAGELKAKVVNFKVEGLGFGTVYALDELDVRIEGVGKVSYKGKPTVKRVVEGLGSVQAI